MRLVRLEPPLTRGGGQWPGEPLTEARPYLRTRRMTRWHEPRSGYRLAGQERTVLSMWCGQTILDLDRAIACDVPPDGEPACGTCAGRRAGAAGDDGLTFTPETLARPVKCPGRADHYVDLGNRIGRCLTCGAVTRLWFRGGPYNSTDGLTIHQTGPELVDPCPFHAWRNLCRHPTTSPPSLICACRIHLI